MKARLHFFIFLAISILFAACSKTNKQGRLVPATASVVLEADGKSLLSKVSWEEVKQNHLFQTIYQDSNLQATIKKLLDNPEKAGIDINNDLILFLQKDSIGGYVCIEGNIKDAAALKAFNTELTANGAETENDGIHFISKSPLCAAWSNEKFVYLIDAPSLHTVDNLSKRMMDDSIDVYKTFPSRDILATARSIFALSESNSLAKNERFTALINKAADMRLWINFDEIYKSLNSLSAFAMVNLDKFTKSNAAAFAVSFENGKIVLDGHTYSGEELSKLYKKYSGGKVSEDMLKRLPGKDVIAMGGFNFKPEGLKEFLKLFGLDGILNLGLSQAGFTFDDFIKANKGDIVFSIADMQFKKDSAQNYLFKDDSLDAPPITKPDFNFSFAASIGDKESFNKLINAGKRLGGAVSNQSALPVNYNSNGSYFVMSNTKENADKFLAGGDNNAELVNKISGEPFGGYISLQNIFKIAPVQEMKDSAGKVAFNESVKMWDNILWKGGSFDNGGLTHRIEVNLMDKNTNSLKLLNQYMNKIGQLYQERKKKEQQEIMAFENDTIPPPAESKPKK